MKVKIFGGGIVDMPANVAESLGLKPVDERREAEVAAEHHEAFKKAHEAEDPADVFRIKEND